MERRIPENYSVSFLNHVSEKDLVYFVDEMYNGIFSYDRSSRKLSYFGNDMRCFCRSTYIYVAKWGNKIAAIPYDTSVGIFLMDINDGTNVKTVCIDISKSSVHDVIPIDNKIYFSTCEGTNAMYVFDFNTDKVSVITKEHVWNGYPGIPASLDNFIYCSDRLSNLFIGVDIKTGETKKKALEDDFLLGATSRIANDKFFFNESNTNFIYCCDVNALYSQETTLIYHKIIDNSLLDMTHYSDFFVDMNYLYLLPNDDNCIIKVNLDSKEIEKIDYPEGFAWVQDERYKRGVRFQDFEIFEDAIYLFPRVANGILIIDRKSGETRIETLQFDIRELIKERAEEIDINNVFDMEINLELYLYILGKRK